MLFSKIQFVRQLQYQGKREARELLDLGIGLHGQQLSNYVTKMKNENITKELTSKK